MSHPLRHPLVLFLFIGVGLFVLDGFLREEPVDSVSISPAQREQLREALERQGRLSPEALEASVQNWLDEEILVREARRLNLVEDDPIVRRRMAQVMRFYIAESEPLSPPTRAQLEQQLAEQPDRYKRPESVGFVQHFFSGEAAAERAAQAQKELTAKRSVRGDPFAHGNRFVRQIQPQLLSRFGERFTHRVLALRPSERWHVIGSSLGVHVVQITDYTEAGMARLEEVAAAVQKDWMLQQRNQAVQRALTDLRLRYSPER